MTAGDPGKLCSTCWFCLAQEYGYSNYTIEGTTLSCLHGVNDPLEGYEIPFGQGVEDVLRKAESCPFYQEGTGPTYDVDGEVTAEDFKDIPDLYVLLKKREKTP